MIIPKLMIVKAKFFLKNTTSENISPHCDDYTNTKEISCENEDL